MFYQYELDPNDDLNMEFDDLLKKAIELLEAKKKLASLIYIEKKGQEVENLVETCNNKTRISSMQTVYSLLPLCLLINPPFFLLLLHFSLVVLIIGLRTKRLINSQK